MRPQTRPFLICLVFLLVTSCVGVQVADEGVNPTDRRDWYFDSIIFEIAPIISSLAPDPDALDLFREKLHSNGICRREQVRFLVQQPIEEPNWLLWSDASVVSYEIRHRSLLDLRPDDRHLIVYVSYLSGVWVEGTNIKLLGGLQYAPTSFVIFKDGAGDREAGVLLHEFGHILGMVKDRDCGNHDDDHPHHCANKCCVMYWSTPSAQADFDYYCKQWLRQKLRQRNN